MNDWLLGLLLVIAVIAIIWYLRKQNAQAAEQRKVDEFRRLQAAAAETERAERASLAAAAAPPRVDEPSPVEQGRGFLETAADTASGERLRTRDRRDGRDDRRAGAGDAGCRSRRAAPD